MGDMVMIDLYNECATAGWHYIGDINAVHGGYAIRVDESRDYADVVELTSLWSATDNAEGLAMIECATVPLDCASFAQYRSAMNFCGIKSSALLNMPRDRRAIDLAYALYTYGYRDTDSTEIICFDRIDAESNDPEIWPIDTYVDGSDVLAEYFVRALS